MQSIYDLVKRPLITEKSTHAADATNQYTFEVARGAGKEEIRNAIEKLFSVKVVKICTMVMHGKLKIRGRNLVRRPNWKKAIVTLEQGNKIQLFHANQGV